MRIILLGNAGSGKSTMANRIIGDRTVAHLSLDEIAWDGAIRRPLNLVLLDLQVFITDQSEWVIEGCYGDLIEAALPYCNQLIFLNPGVDVCIDHCLKRPWEPEKFASRADQEANLLQLIEWVKEYDIRDDEYGVKRHRQIFDNFTGLKKEFNFVADYFK